GKLEMESFRLEFETDAFIGGEVTPTNSGVGVKTSDFGSVLSEDRDLLEQAISASTCEPFQLEKPLAQQSEVCKALQKTRDEFNKKFKDKFKSTEVLKDFRAISI